MARKKAVGILTNLDKEPRAGSMRSPKYKIVSCYELPSIPDYGEDVNASYFVVIYRSGRGYICVTKPVNGYAEGVKQRAAIERLNMACGLFSLESLAKCVYGLGMNKNQLIYIENC